MKKLIPILALFAFLLSACASQQGTSNTDVGSDAQWLTDAMACATSDADTVALKRLRRDYENAMRRGDAAAVQSIAEQIECAAHAFASADGACRPYACESSARPLQQDKPVRARWRYAFIDDCGDHEPLKVTWPRYLLMVAQDKVSGR